jgi:hypothetical protein
LVGVSLKNAFDRRTESRLEAENVRNAMLAREAERRLKLDTAVRAVQLLSTSAGTLAPPIQRAGALFTLCNLEQFDLTIALLDSLLSARQIDAASAARIIGDIIARGNELQQDDAASLIVAYTDRFLAEVGCDLPQVFLTGCHDCGEYLRSWAAKIIAKILLARPLAEWNDRPGTLVPLVVGLVANWRDENVEWIKVDAGAILAAVLSHLYPEMGILHVGSQSVDLAEVCRDLKPIRGRTTSAQDLVSQIDRWGHSETASLNR